MKIELTDKQIELLKSAIHEDLNYLIDNQYRYQQSVDNIGHDLKTRNGESFLEIIKEHQQDIDEYEDLLKRLE